MVLAIKPILKRKAPPVIGSSWADILKTSNPLALLVTVLLATASVSFAGSAALSTSRIESLLSDAGFGFRLHPDVQDLQQYGRMTPNTLERHIVNGRVVYTFLDRYAGFLYFGGPAVYRQYLRIEREAVIAKTGFNFSEFQDKPWQDWSWTWQPWKLVIWGYQPLSE
jgi:hypothetical protein